MAMMLAVAVLMAFAMQVRIFRNTGMTNRDTDQPYPSLLFYIGDAPTDNHCEPEESCCCPKF